MNEKKIADIKSNTSNQSLDKGNELLANRIVNRSESITDGYTKSNQQVQHYLQTVSGQLKEVGINQIDHSYSKPWNSYPDRENRSHPTKYLFMKYFPKHLQENNNKNDNENDEIDVVSFDEMKKIPFLTSKPPVVAMKIDETDDELDASITGTWSREMIKLMTRATKIIYSDRCAKLTFEGNVNEVLLKRNQQELTATKFRELFAATFWDMKLVTWLHNTLMKYLNPIYQNIYIESLQILSQKIPALIEKFYKVENKVLKTSSTNPLFNTLSHYKPHKFVQKPIFLIVPSVFTNNLNSYFKSWISLFGSMGKAVVLTVESKSTDLVNDLLNELRVLINDKIRHLKNSFTTRPIILVGFNWTSTLVAHIALQNEKSITAVICLGFALKTIAGCRGELGDILLELTVPIQFIIGENSITAPFDDFDEFRERFRAKTGLVVVGGANDYLIVTSLKKRLECLTQSMVDRCIVDEIVLFLDSIFNPKYGNSKFNEEIKLCKHYFNPNLCKKCIPVNVSSLAKKPRKRKNSTLESPSVVKEKSLKYKKKMKKDNDLSSNISTPSPVIVPLHFLPIPTTVAGNLNLNSDQTSSSGIIKIIRSQLQSSEKQLQIIPKAVKKLITSTNSINGNNKNDGAYSVINAAHLQSQLINNNENTAFGNIKATIVPYISPSGISRTFTLNNGDVGHVYNGNSTISNSLSTISVSTTDSPTIQMLTQNIIGDNNNLEKISPSQLGSTRIGRFIKPPKALDC